MEKRRSKDERELLGKLKMFARFCTPAEYEALVDGMIKAKKLKQQIEILKLYRQMGIRSLEQARQFEIDRKKREMEPRLKKLPLMIPPDKSLSYRQAQAGVDMTEFWGGSSGRRAARSSSLPNNSNSDEDNTRKRRARLGLESCGSSSDEERSSEKRSRKASKTSERDSSAIKDVNQAEELKKLEERKVIVENAPNAQLLSPMEIDLCATVPMLPSHYLMAKEAIVRYEKD